MTGKTIVELSHTISDGMITYQGLPGPAICDYWTREESAKNYKGDTSFQIGRIDLVANTGTYVDVPFHRYAKGDDLAAFPLTSLAELPGIFIDCRGLDSREIPLDILPDEDLQGKAVLFCTQWDRHWQTDKYYSDHPFLSAALADKLCEEKVALAGIDSYNIDDSHSNRRPVHTSLLGQGIPIVEHLCNLYELKGKSFQFSAPPPKISGMGSFPVRAFAVFVEKSAHTV